MTDAAAPVAEITDAAAPVAVMTDAAALLAELEAEVAADAAADAAKEASRVQVCEGFRCTGLVTEWRGYMGWIKPFRKIKHEQADKHNGLVYLNAKDVAEVGGKQVAMKEGKVVDFKVYADGDGLGAEDCRGRAVLRMTLPHAEANALLKDSPQWTEYLSDSEYYPTFERDHGVILRRYSWTLPFVLVEIWGEPEDTAKAAVHLSTKKGESDEPGEECHLRMVLPEDQLMKVDPKPGQPPLKVSKKPILTHPVNCFTITFEGRKDKVLEEATAMVRLITPTAAG